MSLSCRSINQDMVVYRLQRSSVTDAGSSGSADTWTQRLLNVTVFNIQTDSWSSRNLGVITLQPGVYFIQAQMCAHELGRTSCRLRDITNNVTVLSGQSSFCPNSSSANCQAIIKGVVTVEGVTDYEMQQIQEFLETGDGYGVAGNSGEVNNFFNLVIKRLQ